MVSVSRLIDSDVVYSFGGHEPGLRVRPGDVIELTTEDCFGGLVLTPADLPSQVCTFPYLNPVTAPLYVEGAEVGDTLAVHFVDIQPRENWAVSSTFPHFGALTATHTTAMLHDALPEVVWIYDVDRDRSECVFRSRSGGSVKALPLDPMHGTVGVAPAAGEVIMSITPGKHGGNMDTPEMRRGTTAYFGVNVPGGMLSIGDGHCRQGEGEVCGTAVEASMSTAIAVDVIKGYQTDWPRLENDAFLMSTGSARPLEDAFRISQHDMVQWLAELTALETLDAYQLLSQTGLAPAGNVVDTVYTMLAKMPKSLIGEPAYGGMHARLSDIAARYRREKNRTSAG
jgi:acetamidase/formamidase